MLKRVFDTKTGDQLYSGGLKLAAFRQPCFLACIRWASKKNPDFAVPVPPHCPAFVKAKRKRRKAVAARRKFLTKKGRKG